MASMSCLILAVAAPAAAQTPAAPSPAPAGVPNAAFAPAPAPGAAPAPAPAAAAPAAAPGAPAGAPPPGAYAYPPPPGYGYPPPVYAPYPPPLRLNETAPYEGGPVPAGYHVEERARRGLIIGGSLTLGIPWLLSVTAASSTDFSNQSGWLIVPALGPWLTILMRDKDQVCTPRVGGGSPICYDEPDNALRTVLILDGLAQGAGAAMLIIGLASPKKVIARDFVSNLHFSPAPMGKFGAGGMLSGQF